MSDQADQPESSIKHDLPCVGCGYALRGLPMHGNCPECGVSIARSLQGDSLSAADSNWLRGVVKGQVMITWGLYGLTCTIVAFFFAVVAAAVFNVAASPIYRSLAIAIYVLALSSIAVLLSGVRQVTAVEPRESLRESPRSSRIILRTVLSVVVALGLTSLMLDVMGIQVRPRWLPSVLFGLWVVLILVAISLLHAHIGRLGERTPAPQLRDKNNLLVRRFKQMAMLLAFLVVIEPFLAAVGAGWRPALSFFHGCVALVFFVMAIGVLVQAPVLMAKYRHKFRQCLEQSWSAHAG